MLPAGRHRDDRARRKALIAKMQPRYVLLVHFQWLPDNAILVPKLACLCCMIEICLWELGMFTEIGVQAHEGILLMPLPTLY